MREVFKKKFLVVGGRGFIGRALVRRLLELGADVVSLSRRDIATDFTPAGSREVVADLRNPASLNAVLKGDRFDYVFNAVGYIDHSPYFKGGRDVIDTHYIGTLNLLNQVYWSRLKRFVQIGSSDEYGSGLSPQSENLREAPISPYSAAKVGVTHLIQAASRTEDFPGVVVRLFLVYGPGQDYKRFLPQIIKGCLDGRIFPTSLGEQLRDFCYIEDVVEGLLLAALKREAVGRVINIASGRPVSIRRVIEKVVELVGRGQPDFGTYPYRAGENMELHADISLAKSLLDWKPRTNLEEGLKRTIEHYRNSVSGG